MDKDFLNVLTFGHWETSGYFKPEHYHGFIYRITNTRTDEFYLGKRSFTPGWKTYTGSSTLLNDRLKEEYNDFTFEMIELFNNEQDMVMKERQLINSAKRVDEDFILNIN